MAKEKDTKKTTASESAELYLVEEIIEAAGPVFHLNTECVAAALRNVEGKIGIEEAKKLVNEFMNKEVK